MNWLVKVAAFKLLSGLPGGAAFYRYSQKKITRSIIPDRARVGQKLEVGLRYWDWLASHRDGADAPPEPHLDFGAGWHPTIPLLYYSLGMDHQCLLDVLPLLDAEMIRRTVAVFREIVTDPAWPHRSRLNRLPEFIPAGEISGPEYLKQMGMTYRAPYQDRLGELAGSAGMATSTQVLYYIDRDVLLDCFRQIHSCLKKGGRFLATVHLWDTHATAENGLSQYNHLKYSPAAWSRINSPLMSHNRLKAADYRELLETARFKVVHFEVDGADRGRFERTG